MLLTKSNYLLGLQCPKLLWVAKNDKERIPEPDYSAKRKFEAGNIIGVLATKVFPGGIDLSELDFMENIKATKKGVKNRETIYEAGFMVDGLFSRGDILVPVGNDEWDVVEVKSATSVKDVNIHDVSFQKYVYEKAGLKIRDCVLMHINNQYVKNGAIEPEELFVQADINEQVLEFSEGIEGRVENFMKIINSKEEPKCSIGVHCSDPYGCSLMDECWKDVPEGSIFEFYNIHKKKCFELYNGGIVCLDEVPESVKLNDKQKIQRRLACDGGKHIDKMGIKNFLGNLKYPIYYLDFETINPAIPKFDGMKPYQRIPFQFSLHIQKKEAGECEHVSFLAEGTSDPRPKFMQALKDNLGEAGSVLVYNQGFEKGVMRECAGALDVGGGLSVVGGFGEWYSENVEGRVKDLLDVFRNFHYYDPKQKGSCSIKNVLPCLSELKYGDLVLGGHDSGEPDIVNGMLASNEYERVTYGLPCVKDGVVVEGVSGVSEEERVKVREALERYCEMDTWAEVEIVKELNRMIHKKTDVNSAI